MLTRLIIAPRAQAGDPRARGLEANAKAYFGMDLTCVQTRDAYVFTWDFAPGEAEAVRASFTDPVAQESWLGDAPAPVADWLVIVGFRPGVTDNVGTTARQTIEDYLGVTFAEGELVSSSQLYLARGRLSLDEVARLAAMLANPLINRVSTKTRQEYGEKGMDAVVPRVRLSEEQVAGTVNLDISDAELAKIGKDGIADPATG